MNFFSDKAVLVTGGHGFLGAHLVHKLHERGAYEVLAPEHAEVNFLDWMDTIECIIDFKPDIIFHLAAHVGGIHYNLLNPAKLIYENGLMAINIVNAASVSDTKLVAAGSVCAYPEYSPTPTIESNLYNGYPEKSNGAYGTAKRLLLELQRAYYDQHDLPGAHLVSSNLFGPGDNFDPGSSHVVPALITKIQDAIDNDLPYISIWGTGQASRDLLYVDDAVEAYLMAAEFIDCPEPVNIASGQESPVFYIVNKLVNIMGYEGEVIYDKSKPDGQKRRCFQINRMIELTGWTPEVMLDEGLSRVVDYYRREIHNL